MRITPAGVRREMTVIVSSDKPKRCRYSRTAAWQCRAEHRHGEAKAIADVILRARDLIRYRSIGQVPPEHGEVDQRDTGQPPAWARALRTGR